MERLIIFVRNSQKERRMLKLATLWSKGEGLRRMGLGKILTHKIHPPLWNVISSSPRITWSLWCYLLCQSCIHWSSVVLLLQQIDKGIKVQGVQWPSPTDFTRRLCLQEAPTLLSCRQMSYGKNVLAHKFYIDHAVSILSTYNNYNPL